MADELVITDAWRPDDPPTNDAAMLWHVLMHASKSPVSIVDINGKFLAGNDLLEEAFAVAPGTIVGRNLSEFLPPELVEDRLAVIRQVAATGKPANLSGVTWGVAAQCAFRPLPTPPGGIPRVLHVLGPAGRDPHGVPTHQLRFEHAGTTAELTERELEILGFIGEGLSTSEIASRLHRSVKTIEWHRASLGTKLKAANRVELAQHAIKLGLVKDPSKLRIPAM